MTPSTTQSRLFAPAMRRMITMAIAVVITFSGLSLVGAPAAEARASCFTSSTHFNKYKKLYFVRVINKCSTRQKVNIRLGAIGGYPDYCVAVSAYGSHTQWYQPRAIFQGLGNC